MPATTVPRPAPRGWDPTFPMVSEGPGEALGPPGGARPRAGRALRRGGSPSRSPPTPRPGFRSGPHTGAQEAPPTAGAKPSPCPGSLAPSSHKPLLSGARVGLGTPSAPAEAQSAAPHGAQTRPPHPQDDPPGPRTCSGPQAHPAQPSPAHPLAEALLRGPRGLPRGCVIRLTSVPQTGSAPHSAGLRALPASPPPNCLCLADSAATSSRRASDPPPILDVEPASAPPLLPTLPTATQGSWPAPWRGDTSSKADGWPRTVQLPRPRACAGLAVRGASPVLWA